MTLSRRTFIQTGIATSVTAAAHATRNSWLLVNAQPVRVALVGLAGLKVHDLTLYSSIPGAEVVALVDEDHSRLSACIKHLLAAGQRRPRVYSDVREMLKGSTVEAVVVKESLGCDPALVRSALSAKLPLLFDSPPSSVNSLPNVDAIAQSCTPWFHLLRDYSFPASYDDVASSVARIVDHKMQAIVSLPQRRLSELRAPIIVAVSMMLNLCPLSISDLKAYYSARGELKVKMDDANLTCRICLPANRYGLDELRLQRLDPCYMRTQMLVLRSLRGSVRIQIASDANPHSSASTVLQFLAACRGKGPCDNRTASMETIAASVVDTLIDRYGYTS